MTGCSLTGCSSGLGSLLGGVLSTGANIYGAQNAAEAATNADLAGINTQQQTMGNINSLYGTQQQLGQGAMQTLGSTLGTNGQPANYSNFLNMPGYQFAVQQGTQAIQRQAAAQGNSYTPNAQAAVGQYVTGTASQDYNTYVSQLEQAAGLGSTANQALATANYNTGTNISQLEANTGQAQANGILGATGAASSGIGNILGSGGNGSGILGNIFGGGSSGGGNTSSGNNGTGVGAGAGSTSTGCTGAIAGYNSYGQPVYYGQQTNTNAATGCGLYVPGAGTGCNTGYISYGGTGC
jgi:hypothetical protein